MHEKAEKQKKEKKEIKAFGAIREFFKPIGLSFPKRNEVVKGMGIVLGCSIVCSAFCACIDTATAFVVSLV